MKQNMTELEKAGKRMRQRVIAAHVRGNTTELAATFRKQFETPKWDWPRETVRSNGSVVDSPRDIVDTGELRDSYSNEVRNEGKTVAHIWSAKHAAIRYLGGTDANGNYRPGADWVQGGLDDTESGFYNRNR